MLIPITNPTAINYWLKEAVSSEPVLSYSDISKIIIGCTPADIIRDSKIYHLDPPVDILLPKAAYRRNWDGLSPHVLSNIHHCTFVELTGSLYMISPETAFLLAANHRSLPELVCLACDLCAFYKPDPFSPFGQTKREPVTSVHKLKEYLLSVDNVFGLRKARQAISYALDNSASPMESRLATLFRLPFCMGGGGISDISLNKVIYLSPEAAAFLGKDSCTCDICSNTGQQVFEYDSNLTHLSADQHSFDKKRSTALQMSGFRVFTITADNLRSHQRIDSMILSARSFMKLRTHMERFEKYRSIRWRTYDMLFFTRQRQ